MPIPAINRTTGLTLGFSRAISLPSQYGDLEAVLSQGIEVADQDGYSWPVQVSNYDESRASLSYLFDEALPPGHYSGEVAGEQVGLIRPGRFIARGLGSATRRPGPVRRSLRGKGRATRWISAHCSPRPRPMASRSTCRCPQGQVGQLPSRGDGTGTV